MLVGFFFLMRVAEKEDRGPEACIMTERLEVFKKTLDTASLHYQQRCITWK
jgi:hypothetical protein